MRAFRTLSALRNVNVVTPSRAATLGLLAPFRPRGSQSPSQMSGGADYSDSNSNSNFNTGGEANPFPSRGAGGGFAGGPGASLAPKPHLQETPTKDRMPPATYNPRDPRRRLAVLIDGSRVDASTYATVIEPMVLQYGIPTIVRVFDTELRDGWLELVEPSLNVIGGTMSTASSSSSSASRTRTNNSRSDSPNKNFESATLHSSTNVHRAAAVNEKGQSQRLPAVEWFRMDRFIPVNVQIAADTQHLFDFRSGNKVEGVCVVCTEGERAARFEKYFPRLEGKGFTQISLDEKGPGVTLIEDGRDGDGSGGLGH